MVGFSREALCLCASVWSHLEVELSSSSSHAEAEGRRINPTITFPKDEELILTESWELGEETLQGFIIIFGDLGKDRVKGKDFV